MQKQTVLTLSSLALIAAAIAGTIIYFYVLKDSLRVHEVTLERSRFGQPQEVGSAAFRAIENEAKRFSVLMIGVTPNFMFSKDVAQAIVDEASRSGLPFDLVLQEERLEPLSISAPTRTEKIKLNQDMNEFAAQLQSLVEQGQRILIYSANLLTMRSLEGNPASRLAKAWPNSVLSVSMVSIRLNPDEREKPLEPPCVGSERDGQGTSPLGCAALLKARAWKAHRAATADPIRVSLVEQFPASYLLYLGVSSAVEN